MRVSIKKLEIKEDKRGWLAEIVRPEDIGEKKFGLVLMTTVLPGQTKGNHYHKRKTEWYCVIKGDGLLTLTDQTTKEKKEMEIGEKNMVLVKIPSLTIHSIKNMGTEELYLLAYVDEVFNPSDPDTYAYNE